MALTRRQSQDTSQPKAPLTPEQRKLYGGLAVAGVLVLLAGGLYLPKLLGGGDTTTATPASTPTGTPAADAVAGGTGNVPGGDVSPGQGAAPATMLVSASSQPLTRSRTDPFQQLYFIPTPTPVPPVAPPLVPLPPPVPIPIPGEDSRVFLPGTSSTREQLQQPLNLPPVSINRLDETSRRPTDAFPPRRSAGGEGAGGGGASDNPSANKRLSGIVIGEGVRALLEIQGPNGPVTRVVQPGDEIDGITVLSIQRYNDGTRTVTRMIIRENGEERTVDLRAGAPVTPQGGPGGQTGAAGGGQ